MTKSLQYWSLLVAIICAMVGSGQAAEHTKDSLPSVQKNIEEKKAVLVDVREKSEWDSGHINGAVLLPLSELRNVVDAESLKKKLPNKDRIVYTHCVVGKRSLEAADILAKHGYTVRALKPGYKDLLGAGFEKAEK